MSERIEDDILVEARRAIEIQVAQLDELRARTGLLFAAASLSASFLGSATADGRVSLGFWGSAAVIAFVCAIGACIKVLWPKKEAWTFVTSQKHLIREWVKTERPDEVERRPRGGEKAAVLVGEARADQFPNGALGSVVGIVKTRVGVQNQGQLP